jgi:hypothetical protein
MNIIRATDAVEAVSNEYRSSERSNIVMSTKIVTAALVAAALTGIAATTSASAQTYDGGPACAYGENYDAVNERCVSNYRYLRTRPYRTYYRAHIPARRYARRNGVPGQYSR